MTDRCRLEIAAHWDSPIASRPQWRSMENSSTWVRRMLLPDGSRNDVSMP